MNDSALLIGAGEHARVLLATIKESQPNLIQGVVDVNPDAARILQLPFLGDDQELPALYAKGYRCFVLGVGSTKQCSLRETLFLQAVQSGLEPVSVIHPLAWIASDAVVGQGCQILVRSVVNVGAVLGKNVLVNTAAVIEHDCVVGDHSHIATGALLCGSAKVGKSVHIGAGAIIRQGLKIGDNAVIAAGAVVVESVPANCLVQGVPAKRVAKD